MATGAVIASPVVIVGTRSRSKIEAVNAVQSERTAPSLRGTAAPNTRISVGSDMTADRKAALMEYAMALQGELDTFTDAMFGPAANVPADDLWTAADLMLKRLEVAARLYISSGAMLTVTRWQKLKNDQVEAQRAALKAEASPIPSEGGAALLEPARQTPAERMAHADQKDEAFMAAWVKLVDDATERKLSEQTFRALIADGIVKKAAPDGGLADKLKAIYSERVKETLLSKAKEAGWRQIGRAH